jgi:hypothetical protein
VVKKKRNPTDITLRNLRALKKRLAVIEHRVGCIEEFIEEFELTEVFSPRDILSPREPPIRLRGGNKKSNLGA